MKLFRLLSLGLVLSVAAVGCSDGTTTTPGSASGTTNLSQATTLDIVETAQSFDPEFATLVAAVVQADLVGTLSDNGMPDNDFTVLAPTNAAFDRLPGWLVSFLLEDANRDLLTDLLLYHVIEGEVPEAVVRTLDSAPTVLGQDVRIRERGNGRLFVNRSEVIIPDVFATNGVIHAVDRVLIPRGFLFRVILRLIFGAPSNAQGPLDENGQPIDLESVRGLLEKDEIAEFEELKLQLIELN